MKKLMIIAAGVVLIFSNSAFAQGDAAKGEKVFKKCKACHTIADGDEVHLKGGRTGPNLFGVIGRIAGSTEFKYSGALSSLGDTGLIWTEELLSEYVVDPKAFLQAKLDDSAAKSKMTFKLKKGGEDVASFLATFISVQ